MAPLPEAKAMTLLPALTLLAMLVASPVQAAAACAQNTTSTQVKSSLDATETAFAKLDRGEVLASSQAATDALACLGEALPTDVAARFHRARGLAFFLAKDTESARLSFAASRALVPAPGLPSWIAPAGNPIQQDFVAIALEGLKSEPVPATSARFTFDGRPGVARPVSVPTILQILGADGRPSATFLLKPGDPLPAGAFPPVAAPPPVAPVAVVPPPQPVHDQAPVTEALPVAKKEHAGPNRGLLWGAGGAIVVSGACYALAMKEASAHADATDLDTLENSYKANHRFVIASAGTAVIGVGLGTTALLVAHW
jgi:hypothetical protein